MTLVQRFRKRAEDDEAALDDEWSASEEGGSDEGEEEYCQNKPIYAFWAEKGLIKPQNMRRSQTPGSKVDRKRRVQVNRGFGADFAMGVWVWNICSNFCSKNIAFLE